LRHSKNERLLEEKESGKQVKRFRTDGGGESTSKKFAEYLKSEGILKTTTTPYTPQSNGVVQRAIRTIMERVRCLLDDAGLSKKYWAFAVSVVVYLKNRTLTGSVVGKTPYEAWHGRKPSLKHLRGFGCLAFVHVPKEKRKKLHYRATPGIFVGYSISTK
jgi:transposase InsO family protein